MKDIHGIKTISFNVKLTFTKNLVEWNLKNIKNVEKQFKNKMPKELVINGSSAKIHIEFEEACQGYERDKM